MSARAYHHILKLARTIADPSALLRTGLAGSERIETVHVAEPIHLRPAEAAVVKDPDSGSLICSVAEAAGVQFV